MSNDLFIKASRQPLRFVTSKGALTVEDLWNLHLNDLNTLAVSYDKQLKESGISFITTKTDKTAGIQLQFDIVKYIIDVRLAEAAAKEQKYLIAAKRDQILEVIARKERSAIEGKSLEELRKELELLEA